MKKFIIVCFVLVFFLISFYQKIYSQDNEQVLAVTADETLSCETVSAILDSFVLSLKDKKTLLIISYQGKNERFSEMAKRRLHNMKLQLTEFYKERASFFLPETFLTAIANEKTQEAAIEFYLDGKLKFKMFFKDNADLWLSPCYMDTDRCKHILYKRYYPCLDRLKREKKIKTKSKVRNKMNSKFL